MSEHAEKLMVEKMPALAVPTAIVGARVNGKANFNTLGCFGLVSMVKLMVYIMSGKTHYTNLGIRESGYFSVNIPSNRLVVETDYVGIVSGHDTDKSGVFLTFCGSVDEAPMIRECPVNLLCKVVKSGELSNEPTPIISEFFIGEVLEVYVNKDCLTDGKPDIRKINPLLLAGAGSQIQVLVPGGGRRHGLQGGEGADQENAGGDGITAIDHRRTALVAIDLQQGIAFPSRPMKPYTVGEVVANAALLANAFRKTGMPVFLVHVVPTPETLFRPIADMIVPAPKGHMPAGFSDFVPEAGARALRHNHH